MSAQPLAPAPRHLLRSHSSPLSSLSISVDNERVFSADGSGKVVITSTRTLRPIASWAAHTDLVLGVEEWEDCVLTHGRDNKIHVWELIKELPFSKRIGASAGLSDLPTPKLKYSMDVNALNFCRFSLLRSSGTGSTTGPGKPEALIALPNLVDSTTVDIWKLPSMDRLHAAIGQEIVKPLLSENPGGRNSSGIIMSIHLYRHVQDNGASRSSSPNQATKPSGKLRVLAAYEDGSVVLRQYVNDPEKTSIEGQGWEILWKAKLHTESIMAMRVSRSNTFALTVSADHIVGWYNLADDLSENSNQQRSVQHKTKHPGNASIAIRDDGKVCAIGGWDGKIRLYSTKSFKPLGTLKYHKAGCQCLEFARSFESPVEGDTEAKDGAEPEAGEGEGVEDDEDGELTLEDKIERSRWLVAGSKDNRVSIWPLISFAK